MTVTGFLLHVDRWPLPWQGNKSKLASPLLRDLGFQHREALRAHAVAELGFRLLANVPFKLVPLVVFVADALAVHACWQNPLKQFYLVQGLT